MNICIAPFNLSLFPFCGCFCIDNCCQCHDTCDTCYLDSWNSDWHHQCYHHLILERWMITEKEEQKRVMFDQWSTQCSQGIYNCVGQFSFSCNINNFFENIRKMLSISVETFLSKHSGLTPWETSLNFHLLFDFWRFEIDSFCLRCCDLITDNGIVYDIL